MKEKFKHKLINKINEVFASHKIVRSEALTISNEKQNINSLIDTNKVDLPNNYAQTRNIPQLISNPKQKRKKSNSVLK